MKLAHKAYVMLLLGVALFCTAPAHAAAPSDDVPSREEIQSAIRSQAARLGLHNNLPEYTGKIQKLAIKSARKQRVQTELPLDPANMIKAQNQRKTKDVSDNIDLPDVDPSSVLSGLKFTLWAAVILLAAIIAYTLYKSTWSSSRSRRIQHVDPETLAPTATAARMDKAQVAADDLARDGSFAEAMRVLLLQSVDELRLRLDVSIASSLTSREILQRIGLSPQTKVFFADIIRRVEIYYFGEYQATEQDYLVCRNSYDALRTALQNPASSVQGGAS